MQIQALGYIGVVAQGLDDWAHFGTHFLGMQQVDRTQKRMALRMDDRKQRVIIEDHGHNGLGYLGWETADQAALDALAARLVEHKVAVETGSRALCEERKVKGLIRFKDPLENQIEAFWGAETTEEPFKPGRSISGFRTGPLGMGHAVLQVESIDAVVPFYRDVLGMHTSDYMQFPFKAHFFHVNPRQHSFALLEWGRKGFELYSLDDVGQGYDIAQMTPDIIKQTFGRHINDHVTSFYTQNPSNFMVEYGWGGRSIDVDNWTPKEVVEGPSLWGHERLWLPPEGREKARELRTRLAEEGLRIPLDVMEGNHKIAPGTCALWDGIVEARKRGYA